jgi:hypothetical protein
VKPEQKPLPLERVLDRFRETGWVQHSSYAYGPSEGPPKLCLSAACSTYSVTSKERAALYEAIRELFPLRGFRFGNQPVDLVSFNDDRETTFPDVELVVTEAIAKVKTSK